MILNCKQRWLLMNKTFCSLSNIVAAWGEANFFNIVNTVQMKITISLNIDFKQYRMNFI